MRAAPLLGTLLTRGTAAACQRRSRKRPPLFSIEGKDSAEAKAIEPQPIHEKVTQGGESNDHRDEQNDERYDGELSHDDATPRPDKELFPEPGLGASFSERAGVVGGS